MINRRESHTTLRTMNTISEDSVAMDTVPSEVISPENDENDTVPSIHTVDKNDTVGFEQSQSSARTEPDEHETYHSNPRAGEQETPFKFTGRHYHTGKLTKLSNQQIDAIGPYKILSKLGSGGMGDVFKAYDRSLGRHLALKVIRDEDSDAVARFMREAQVQARVIHENVCKIYEVGEIDGKPFIAMQYIEGETLKNANKQMSISEKLQVIINAAEAVHEAHKQGLIHRDIKPDNIMVERLEQGWKPYVVDFGIAREQISTGMTMTGAVIGTPQYMSPEQAKGEVHSLDARSDIYSLGATLYWLLSGRHLYNGSGLAQVLFNIVNKEAEPLRKVVPELPLDLETIVMKCLEKDPARRYTSAKALADDLRYYLAGDPISARPLTQWQLLVRKAKKHRAITITIAIATIMVTVMSCMGIYSYWTAAEQAALAQQLGQEIERIDSIMRQAHLMPQHDLTTEKQIIAQRIKLIEDLMQRRGKAGVGVGHYAIGRALLIQGQSKEALEHLQKSWQSGYQKPEVAYWLGRALGDIYQQESRQIDQIANKSVREQRRKELEKEYRGPALYYLNLGRSEGASEYGEALIAFYEQRMDEALAKSALALKQMPWLYEAKKLTADIYISLGREEIYKGDSAKGRESLVKAGELYHEVMTIARSDKTVFKSECDRLSRMIWQTPERDSERKNYFDQACQACDQALIIDPNDAETYRQKSYIYHQWAIGQLYQDQDPLITMEQAMKLAQQALIHQPNDEQTYQLIADINGRKGEYELRRGQDPRPTYIKTIENCQKVLEIKPDKADSYHSMAAAYWRIGSYELSHNINGINALEKALENCDRVLEIDSTNFLIYNTVGAINSEIANYLEVHGQDPLPRYQTTIANYEKNLQSNPNAHVVLYNLVIAYSNVGRYQAERGVDPMEWYQKGLEAGQRSFQIDPTFALNVMGDLYGYIGQYQRRQHQDARASLSKAIEYSRASIKHYPTYPYTYIGLSSNLRELWEYQYLKGENDRQLLDEALASCKKALEVNATYSPNYDELATIYLLMAKYKMLPNATNKESLLNQAQAAINRSIELNATAVSYEISAQIALMKARQAITEKRSPSAEFQQAESALQKALAINSQYRKAYQTQSELESLRK